MLLHNYIKQIALRIVTIILKLKHQKRVIKSESSTIRWLRGVFDPPTPSQNREIKILRNKLPLTLELKRKYAIVDSSTFKFHYRSAEELLDDFEHYLYTFKGLKKATSKQFMGDVKSIWMCVHPNLNLHPNQLVETEFLEYRFFMLEKVKLVENKDKEPEDQTRHIQAGTIKNKLSCLKHFIKFKVQRKCFIDLNKVQLQDLKAKSKELRSNFKNLCKSREKKHKGL